MLWEGRSRISMTEHDATSTTYVELKALAGNMHTGLSETQQFLAAHLAFFEYMWWFALACVTIRVLYALYRSYGDI